MILGFPRSPTSTALHQVKSITQVENPKDSTPSLLSRTTQAGFPQPRRPQRTVQCIYLQRSEFQGSNLALPFRSYAPTGSQPTPGFE